MVIFSEGIILVLFMYGLTIKTYDVDCLNLKQTTAIKGLCAILVFFRHIMAYLEIDMITQRMLMIQDVMGQMIVVPFLFYSGYGLLKSIQSKKDYLKHFWKNRICKFYFEFLVIWFFFLLIDCCLQENYDKTTIFKSLFAWKSIGNSTWFLFGIMIMYISTWISFTVTKSKRFGMVIMLLFVVIYYYILYKLKSDTHWYDTIIAFYVGMLYECFEERKGANLLSFRNSCLYFFFLFLSGGVMLAILVLSNYMIGIDKLYQFTVILATMTFLLFLLIFSTRIQVGNPTIEWLGIHCFEIYMLQRIPMMICRKIGWGV